MHLPTRMMLALKLLTLIDSVEIEWVPFPMLLDEVKIHPRYCKNVLDLMAQSGIIQGRQGSGGYRRKRLTSLQELGDIFSTRFVRCTEEEQTWSSSANHNLERAQLWLDKTDI